MRYIFSSESVTEGHLLGAQGLVPAQPAAPGRT